MKKLLVYIKDFRLECVLAPLFKLLEADSCIAKDEIGK